MQYVMERNILIPGIMERLNEERYSFGDSISVSCPARTIE